MRINRINIIISSAQNTHRKYLYNECLDLMNRYKVGGLFNPNVIKFNNIESSIKKDLTELGIKFMEIT